MRSASECREHAKDCRALALHFDGERQQQTLAMAETWENLARQVDAANNLYISAMLQANYEQFAREPVPEIFVGLLKQLEAKDSRRR